MYIKYLGRGDNYTLSPVRPQVISAVARAFPADIGKLMPAQEEVEKIPESYLREAMDFVTTWFHRGLDRNTRWTPATGVQLSSALEHISACMASFAPKHEDKILGCAVLVLRFFDNVKYRPNSDNGKWVSFNGVPYENRG